MPGQRGSETRQRDHMYTIRWSAAEAKRLDEIVAASACSKADVLRRLVAYDHGRLIPTHDLTRQIHAVGNNLNQITKSIHALRLGAGPGGSAATLAQLSLIEADFRKAYDAIVQIQAQMEDGR